LSVARTGHRSMSEKAISHHLRSRSVFQPTLRARSLTFDINSEMIVPSECGAVLPRTVGAILPLFVHLFFLVSFFLGSFGNS
jgi:hypothetical protein